HDVALAIAPDDVLDRGRDEEILLGQPQLTAGRGGVVRIEDATDALRAGTRLDGAHVITLVELVEIELTHRPRAPQPERVHRLVAVSRDRRVVRRGQHVARVHPGLGEAPGRVVDGLGAAVELYAEAVAGPGDLPGVAIAEPAIGDLDLGAVDDALVEDAVVVADAVSIRGIPERRHRVEEARSQPAEAAIAEPGVPL